MNAQLLDSVGRDAAKVMNRSDLTRRLVAKLHAAAAQVEQ